MTFSADLQRFVTTCETRDRDVFVRLARLAHQSIQNGSPITGAPGQPVDTGELRASWQLAFEAIGAGIQSALIGTNVEYARQIEDGTRAGRALTLRSQRGGWHSVALTIAGHNQLLAEAARD